MKLSPYFHDQIATYQAEIDDLTSDSEGKDVLQKRLKDKRSAFRSILPMMDTDPALLASAFHGAFEFPRDGVPVVEEILAAEFGDFPPWAVVSSQIGIASWAHPLMAMALAEPLGEEFLALVVGLEYAFSRHGGNGAPAVASDDDAPERGDDERAGEDDGVEGRAGEHLDSDEAGGDAGILGDDFLEQQGFDRRTPK
jgi:hypothetical protein